VHLHPLDGRWRDLAHHCAVLVDLHVDDDVAVLERQLARPTAAGTHAHQFG
jgi:hypothetical protein